MKEVSKEERQQQRSGGEEQKETGFMNEWFKDFDEMSKSLFGDFSKIDQEIDRRFKDFSDMMEKNRQRQLQEFK